MAPSARIPALFIHTIVWSWLLFMSNILSLPSCFYLIVLIFDNNLLKSRIPPQLGLLSRISIFTVASILLSVPGPNFVQATFTEERYADDIRLSGGPLENCEDFETSEDPWMDFRDSFIKGSLFAWGACAVSVVLILNYVPGMHEKMMRMEIVKLLMTRKNKKIKPAPIKQALHEQGKEMFMLEKFFARLSYTDLSNATDNFSQDNVIGLGTMGTMYKATLPGGLVLAVQRLHMSQLSMEHFVSELTMGRLRHRNLVPLLAFCEERKKRLLVYKYMTNGNLYDWLQHSKVGATTMEWPARAKIAIGLARGLAWLHNNCNFRVIHLDISSKCILLDENFEPKMSNLGRAMFMNPNDTDLSKTFFANNVLQESNLVKKDVLKFGVVLLELITGEDPIKNKFSFYYRSWTLAERVNHLSSSSAILNDAVDKSLIGQGFDVEIFHFLRIACNCVQFVPDQRPTMLEVYKMLKAAGERNGLTNDHEILMQNEIVAADSGEEWIELD